MPKTRPAISILRRLVCAISLCWLMALGQAVGQTLVNGYVCYADTVGQLIPTDSAEWHDLSYYTGYTGYYYYTSDLFDIGFNFYFFGRYYQTFSITDHQQIHLGYLYESSMASN